ncbi:MAG TPA: TlpA disulfide reductase family protein [Edaphobacter sp.]|nr:TlpA disulfide reductase family protein [Edaphobacter sp.]
MLFFSLRGRRFGSGEITPIAARKPAPNMELQQMNGDDWKLQDHRGEVVLINLWATWCGPCREETPGLVQLYETMHSRGLEIVGLSLDTGGREKVQSFVRQFQVPYTIAFPEPMSQLADTLEGVPTTILIDKQGRVAKTYVGAMQQQVFAADVEALMKES